MGKTNQDKLFFQCDVHIDFIDINTVFAKNFVVLVVPLVQG